jgi:hypothetical protein
MGYLRIGKGQSVLKNPLKIRVFGLLGAGGKSDISDCYDVIKKVLEKSQENFSKNVFSVVRFIPILMASLSDPPDSLRS